METVRYTRGLAKNAFFNMFLTLSQIIIPLITFPYVSRVLAPEGVGQYDFLNSFIGYFSMAAMLGIPTYAIKACAVVRDDRMQLSKTIHEVLIINSISALVSIAVLTICVTLIAKLNSQIMLVVIIGVGLYSQCFGMSWLCSAMEQYAFISIKSVGFNILNLILIFILVKDENDVGVYAAIIAISLLLSNLTNVLYLKKYFTLKHIGNYNLKKHLKPIIVFFCFTIATTIYTNIDRVMIGFMMDDTAVGLYSTSYKINHLIVTVITSISSVLLPRLSYLIKQGQKEAFDNLIKKAVNIVLILAIPSIIFFEFYAKDAIFIFLGDQYELSVVPMKILLPTLLFIGLTNLIGMQYLVPIGKEKHMMISTICGAIVDIVINAILIPIIGINGAAIGTLVAEATVLIYQGILIKKDIKVFLKGINIKSIICIILFTLPCIAVLNRYVVLQPYLELLIGVLSFGLLYLLALFVSKNEIIIMVKNFILSKLHKTCQKNAAMNKSEMSSDSQDTNGNIEVLKDEITEECRGIKDEKEKELKQKDESDNKEGTEENDSMK